ncbi:hypothetical protein VNO77_20516 [Canavalia gladiata]|uniref:Uncharacterized protein n=1 Tax=Canavalia gladiata TaxID=3824 RepID=A0AAN9QJF0_CANGL
MTIYLYSTVLHEIKRGDRGLTWMVPTFATDTSRKSVRSSQSCVYPNLRYTMVSSSLYSNGKPYQGLLISRGIEAASCPDLGSPSGAPSWVQKLEKTY